MCKDDNSVEEYRVESWSRQDISDLVSDMGWQINQKGKYRGEL